MKRIVLFTLCLLLTLSAVGCGKQPASVEAPPAATAAPTPAPTTSPTPSPSPTPIPLTDLVYDDGGVKIWYSGEFTVSDIPIYVLYFYNSTEKNLFLCEGEITINEDSEKFSITGKLEINNRSYYVQLGTEGYQIVPAGTATSLVIISYGYSDGNLEFVESPDTIKMRFSAMEAGVSRPDTKIVFDTGDFVIDAAKHCSTKQVNQDRRDLAQKEGGYTGLMFSSIDLNGETVTDSIIQEHQLTVLNFWATWCSPCKKEIPVFSKVAAAYADKGVAFLGVQTDADLASAKKLWENSKVSYNSVFASDDLFQMSLEQESIPVTVILDPQGNQIGEPHVGSMTEKELTSMIEEALSAAQPANTPVP